MHRKDSVSERVQLRNEFERRECELSDLHAHLMGMGDADFWIDNLMCGALMIPGIPVSSLNQAEVEKIALKVCRDIEITVEWSKDNHDDDDAFLFLPMIVQRVCQEDTYIKIDIRDAFKRYPDGLFLSAEHSLALVRILHLTQFWNYVRTSTRPPPVSGSEEREIHTLVSILEKFVDKHRGRSMIGPEGITFSSDVVYSLDSLQEAFGIPKELNDVALSFVCDRLCLNSELFRLYVVFNAREQELDLRYGITNQDICVHGLGIGNTEHSERFRVARNHIRNCFSLLSSVGGVPCIEDLSTFRGFFTPEFYPKRFVLRDAIYEQRLDVLVRLLEHCLRKYSVIRPPVSYVEFSVGVKDLSSLHTLAFLLAGKQEIFTTVERQKGNDSAEWHPPIPLKELQFRDPSLMFAVEYRFLAGFNRSKTMLPVGKKINTKKINTKRSFSREWVKLETAKYVHKAWKFLLKSNKARTLFLQSLSGDDKMMFKEHFKKLEKFKESFESQPAFCSPRLSYFRNSVFRRPIVGFDWMGDEFAIPYCPFGCQEFVDFATKYNFGFRIHAGENAPPVPPRDDRLLHVYFEHLFIVLITIRKILEQNARIRIGHAIAFGDVLYKSRFVGKISGDVKILLESAMKKVCCEICPSSNSMLLLNDQGGDVSTHQFHHPVPRVISEFHALRRLMGEYDFVISTDDDGVIPIVGQGCLQMSVVSEICSAIEIGLVDGAGVTKCIRNMALKRFSS